MDDMHAYQIEVRGQASEDDLNAANPIHMTVVCTDTSSTLIAIRTDQSGLVGLIRHLHGRGFVLVSVSCKQ